MEENIEIQPLDFSLTIDKLIELYNFIYMKGPQELKTNEKEKYLERVVQNELKYHFWIALFLYQFSYIEELIKEYYSSLFPGYENDSKLSIKEFRNTEDIVNGSYKILRVRSVDILEDFKTLIETFKKLNTERRKIVHGCWGITKGGYALTKAPRKHTNRHNYTHFSSINDLIKFNNQCKELIIKFNQITNMPSLLSKFEDVRCLYKYLLAIGSFLVEFSQLEHAIRANVKFSYEMNEDAFIFVEESQFLSLLEHLSCKFEGPVFEEMKKKCYLLNGVRNTLIHDCFKFPMTIEDIDKHYLVEVKELGQYFMRILVYIYQNVSHQ